MVSAMDDRSRHFSTPPSIDEVAAQYGSLIKRVAAGYENDHSLLEDLVQDIYVSIWRALPKFRGESSLRTFVARIATNRSVTHVIRAMKVPHGTELSDELQSTCDPPEAQAIAHEQRDRLVSAVRSLPLTYRQTALLTLEGLTASEVACALGLSDNAVYVRMNRAREMLKRIMGELE